MRRTEKVERKGTGGDRGFSTDGGEMVERTHESGAWVKAVLDNAPMGVYLVDADFRIREVNPVACPVFGDIPGGVIGRDFDEIVHILWEKDYADELVRIFRRTLDNGVPYLAPERVERRADRGVMEYYEWRIDRIPLPDGRNGVACYFRDVSAQVVARKALEKSRDELMESEERLSTFIRASSDVVYSMSADWSEMRQLRGRDFIADIGTPRGGWLQKYIHRDDHQRVLGAIREAIRTKGIVELEHRVMRKDGTPGWAHSRALPIFDAHGEIVEWLGTASDITARKQAEQALLDSRAQTERLRRLYESILTNTPDLAYIFDLQHRFIYANEGLLTMWGKSLEEAIGKTCLELGYEPWHAEMHDREIEQVVRTRQPIRGEVPFTGTAGRRIYDYIFVPVFGPDGNVEAVAGTTRDVTELRDADRRKDEFLATLSHELRNPLAPLRNALHVMRLQGGEGPLREIMERQVNHLVRLVDDLLEMSRITTGALELRRERIELQTVVRNAIETSAPLIKAARHRLDVSMPGEALWLEGDPVRLAQILANLINNAAKYTPDGGAIALSAWREGESAIVSVRDNGAGIAPESLSRIFEMFSRDERADPRGSGGLGIGLTLSQRLAQMHGGAIEARSEGPGCGSEFLVRLPLTAAAVSAEAKSPPSARLASPLGVLVVDDNRDAAESLGMVLKALGADVHVAHDGLEAMTAFDVHRPAVVLLDIGMPGIDGYEVARRLRAHPAGSRATLVALTGWGQEADRRRAREAGFEHHLVKPAEIDVLQKLLFELERSGRDSGDHR